MTNPFMKALSELVPNEVKIAADHRYACRCADCLFFWATTPEEEEDGSPSYGPFTKEEIAAFLKNQA